MLSQPMRKLARRMVVGTRFEGSVKLLDHRITGNTSSLYDYQTIEIMKRVLKRDSNAIDIGAFEGGMLRHMCRLAPEGAHIAFEPLPEKAAGIRRRCPRATVHPWALADSPSQASFTRVLEYPALSGLKRRQDLPPGAHVQDLTVRTETLDRVIEPTHPVAFIKIDVEGGELGVLRGGMATLRRTRPVVVFECGLGGADLYGTQPSEVFDLLAGLGLRVSLLEHWLQRGPCLMRQDFESQFTKSLNYYFVAHP